MIIIIDFGSQTTHLISRRIREMGVQTKIILPEDADGAALKNTKGIILSGGPASVYEKNAPSVNKNVFNLNIPVLAICYGHQLAAHVLGGKVKPGKKKEFGPATLKITKYCPLLQHLPQESSVWMSHGDEVANVPPGFETNGHTKTIPHAAMSDEKKKIYAIQFHPEVVHTQFGQQILKNFLALCKVKVQQQTINKTFVENLITDIKESIGKEKAICALSGGVDSSVASLLVHQAIEKNLTSIYIDSGLMRQGETEALEKTFKTHFKMNVKIVHAQKIFLANLKGITDPEQKRKIIGKTFIDIFEKEAKKMKAKFLVQGTIYPDVIESAGSKHSQKIKSHHNVGGLPEDMNLALIEPLRTFYKDEVRQIGAILKLPSSTVKRHIFPGPGLAIRIIGEVTEHKLKILREADAILREEIEKAGWNDKLWQVHAIFTGIKTTGVRGDQRAYGETIALGAIVAKDAMSAHWARLPYELLDTISVRIVTEVPAVNRVVYDITNKPPATMEWE